MKKSTKIALTLGSTLLSLQAAYAGIPNNSRPTTFLGPTVKGHFTTNINDMTAYSLVGEVGFRNYPLGGTLGWKLDQSQYLKLSVDYLWQRINYPFFAGDTDQWTHQGSVSGAYLVDFFDSNMHPQVGIKGYYSHATNKNLGTLTGTYNNGTRAYVDFRHIAGSNAAGLAPGASIEAWEGGRVGADLNYDNVRYSTYYANKDAKGVGVTVTVDQVLTDTVNLGLSAAVRQPFNTYTGELDWAATKNWVLGLDADYTVGRNTLPNTYNVSLVANYALDCRTTVAPRQNLKGEVYKDFKDMPVPVKDMLIPWTSKPAVYQPEVLAVPDDSNETGPVIIPR